MNPPSFRLTFRQVEFCRHYALGHSAREAAVRSGYTRLFAKKKSHLLLRHPGIAYRIRQMQNSTRFVSDFHYQASLSKLIYLMEEGTNENRVQLRAAISIAGIYSRQPMLPPDLLEGLEELEEYGSEKAVKADAARQAREGDSTLAQALIIERAAELAEDIRELNIPLPATDGSYDLHNIRLPQDVPGTIEHFDARLKLQAQEKQKRLQVRKERKQQKKQKRLAIQNQNPVETPCKAPETLTQVESVGTHGTESQSPETHAGSGPYLAQNATDLPIESIGAHRGAPAPELSLVTDLLPSALADGQKGIVESVEAQGSAPEPSSSTIAPEPSTSPDIPTSTPIQKPEASGRPKGGALASERAYNQTSSKIKKPQAYRPKKLPAASPPQHNPWAHPSPGLVPQPMHDPYRTGKVP